MTVATANYVFLPWVRAGAAADIQPPDTLGQGQLGAVTVSVKLRINDADDITRRVRLYGPGDVTGIDPQQVVRTEPRNLAAEFEPNYFSAIEFDRPDFPWLFTPAKASTAEKLRPWICLIVVRKQSGVTLRTDRALPLPLLEIKTPARPELELPDLSESWAWAHTQIIGSPRNQTALLSALAGEPALNVSRLLCPRRLDPSTDYLACLVPAFDLGCKAGRGEEVKPADEQRLAPAWPTPPPSQVTLPVYYHWEFRTGTGGDFEALAGLLTPRDAHDLPAGVGKQRVDISRPGFAITPPLPDGTIVELEGALRIADSPAADWSKVTRNRFQAPLKEILDEPWRVRQAEPNADPLLAPPIYGRWHAAQNTVEPIPDPPAPPPSRRWVHELNLDPRHRAAAALGTQVVQAEQEQLMASAWEQLGEIERINQTRRQAQVGRAVNTVYYTNVFSRLSEEAFFNMVAPAQSRIAISGGASAATTSSTRTLLTRAIGGSSMPPGVISAPTRRLSSPRSPVSRRTVQAGASGVKGMFGLFKSGAGPTIRPMPDRGLVTIDKVSQGVQNAINASGGFIWNPDPPPHWERPSVVLVNMLNTFRLQNIGGSAVASKQPPDGMPAPLTEALRAHQQYLSRAFIGIIFGPRPALEVRNAALASLDPAKTISARVNASMIITGDAGQADDDLAPVMDAPEFPQPMYEALRDLAQDYLFPGLDLVPTNTVTLLETNTKFVESFLVGLNAEMANELLWRNYPTDQRGTCFRQFWDTSGGDGKADINKISDWGDHALGKNARAGGKLVMLVRGELLRRYPNSVIYAVKAVPVSQPPDGRLKLSADANDEKHPLFRGTLKPEVTFLGFDLTRTDAIADPGWFFVIQEQPTEPRFGLDAADFTKDLPALTSWNNLSWRHLAHTEAELQALTHASAKTVLPTVAGVTWGKTAAHQAFITMQRPVRVAIHARQLIS
jgi:hypothetical protein